MATPVVGTKQLSTTDSGTITISGLGITPTWAVFWLQGSGGTTATTNSDANVLMGFGATDGTNQWCSGWSVEDAQPTTNTSRFFDTAYCVAWQYVGASGYGLAYSINSFGSGTITLNVDSAPGTDTLLHFACGDGVTCDVGTFNTPTSTGNKDVTTAIDPVGVWITGVATDNTTLGGQSTARWFLGMSDGTTNTVNAILDEDALGATSNSYRGQLSTYIERWLDTASGWSTSVPTASTCTMGTGKFTLNYTDVAATAAIRGYIAWGNCSAEIGAHVQPTTNTTADTTLSFNPEIAFLTGWQTTSTGDTTNARFSFGGTDGTTQRGHQWSSGDNLSTSDTEWDRSAGDTIVYRNYNATLQGQADVSFPGSNKVTLNWTNVDGIQRAGYVFALLASSASEASPGVGNNTLSGLAPSASKTAAGNEQTASPGASDVDISGLTPTTSALREVSASPSLGEIDVTGIAPSVSAAGTGSASPALGIVNVAGIAPTATSTQVAAEASPGLGEVDVVGFAPTVIRGEALVSPVIGIIVVNGLAPAANLDNVTITPATGEVHVEGLVPPLVTPKTASPSTGICTVTGLYINKGEVSISPTSGEVDVSGLAPSTESLVGPGAISYIDVEGIAPTAESHIRVDVVSGGIFVQGLSPEAKKYGGVVFPSFGNIHANGLAANKVFIDDWSPIGEPVDAWSAVSEDSGTWTAIPKAGGSWV